MPNVVGDPSLASYGSITYNGVSLSGPETRLQFSTRNVYDNAGRVVKYVEITIEIEKMFIHEDLKTAFNKLTSPGGELRILGVNFLLLVINPQDPNEVVADGVSKVYDVAWGPKPEILDWQNVSISEGISRLHWTVTAHIPFCPDDCAETRRELMEMNYEVEYSIPETGMVTRTISGSYTVAQTRYQLDPKRLEENAEAYWDRFQPEVPLGFHRTQNSRKLSADKSTMSFTLVDVENESDQPYPEGIVAIDMDESLSNTDISLARWHYTIAATIKVARPYPKAWAWDAFLLFLNERRTWQNNYVAPINRKQPDAAPLDGVPKNGAANIQGGVAYITQFRVSDKTFGRSTSFEVTYLLMADARSIMARSGIWRLVGGPTWSKWRTSMTDYPWSKRGTSGLYLDKNNDALIDLCCNDPAIDNSAYFDQPTPRYLKSGVIYSQGVTLPPPEHSWVDYVCHVKTHQDNGVVTMTTLPTSIGSTSTANNAVDWNNNAVTQNTTSVPSQVVTMGGSNHIIFQRTSSVFHVRVQGYAIRVGYTIQEPSLQSYGGKSVTKISGSPKHSVIGSYQDVPVYLLQWDSVYAVDGAPTNLESIKLPEAF